MKAILQKAQSKTQDTLGPFLREVVFGVHDALLTNIGIVTGFVAALSSVRLIIIASMIDLFISAFAMAFGTYLSRISEQQYLEEQLTDSKPVTDILGNPIAGAVVMWFTYVIAGFIPLLPFFLGISAQSALQIATLLALSVFFIVGLLKGYLTQTSPLNSGLQFLIFGTVAAAIGYLIGTYGQQFLG